MRLFVGVPPPPSVAYSEATARIAATLPGFRAVPAGSWHVTLRFLGDMADPAPVRQAVAEAVAGHAAMRGRVTGLGAFPSPGRRG